MPLAPGPYTTVDIGPGLTAPFYALRFDKRGRSEGPLTEQHLVDALGPGDFTDVFFFSHGWNNDWATALDRYQRFASTFRQLREDHDLDFEGREYRPLLAGVFWPSTALVLPWERGPAFAGDEGDIAADAIDRSLIAELAADVADDQLAAFYELVEQTALTEDEARRLASLVLGVFAGGDPDVESDASRDTDDLVAAWAMIDASLAGPQLAAGPLDFGAVGAVGAAGPLAAGFLDRLDPRNLVRASTVWKMKDRAGAVGAGGVRDLLGRITAAVGPHGTRVHLIGHSYGARLLMAALLGQARQVDSLLLLQPAVNHLCFADALPNGKPGGFRGVLDKVKRPILTTFSANDKPLHDTFHLALRRGKDLGEIEIAGDEPPSQYAALGGYGPRGLTDVTEVGIKDPPDAYDLGPGASRVVAIRGDQRIAGHGDVVSEATAWALYNLAAD